MATIIKPNTFSAGATIIASEHNANFDTIYSDYNGNITNSNIAVNAAIADTKLAQITTAQKVNTSSLVTTSQAIGDIVYADSATSYTRREIGGATTFLAGGTTPSYRQISLISSDTGDILPPIKGGTGKDLSSSAQGGILYLNGTGLITVLAAGTSGLFLQTRGSSNDPIYAKSGLSNVLFSYSGMVDNGGFFSEETSLTTTAINARYAYWCVISQNVYVTIISSKFRKIPGVSTVTIYAYIWNSEVDQSANCKVIIGSTSENVSGTSGQQTPEWKTFDIDVSSLVDETVYDVTIQLLNTNSSNAKSSYLGSIIALGS